MSLEKKEALENNKKSYKKLAIGIVAAVFLAVAITICVIIYINSGYRTIKGSFGYSIKCYTRDYEYKTSSNSIDIFQIKQELRKEGTSDCYIYVWTYSEDQDLNETLEIINNYEKTDLNFMNTTIGAKDYPAVFVSTKNDKGDYQYVYFIDYNDHRIGIQTLSDKKHYDEIEEMLASFTITE